MTIALWCLACAADAVPRIAAPEKVLGGAALRAPGPLVRMEWSEDSKRLALFAANGVNIWKVNSRELLAFVPGSWQGITGDGKALWRASRRQFPNGEVVKKLKVFHWEQRTTKEFAAPWEPANDPFRQGVDFVASVSPDRIAFWRNGQATGPANVAVLDGSGREIAAAAVDAMGGLEPLQLRLGPANGWLTGASNAGLWTWNYAKNEAPVVRTKQSWQQLHLPYAEVPKFWFGESGNVLAPGEWQQRGPQEFLPTLASWKALRPEPEFLRVLPKPKDAKRFHGIVAASADGEVAGIFAECGGANQLCVARAGDDGPPPPLPLPKGTRYDALLAAFSPNGDILAACNSGPAVALVDMRHPEMQAAPAEPDRTLEALAFSSDGRLLAAAGHNGRGYVYETGQWTLRPHHAHGPPANVACFSPKNDRLFLAWTDLLAGGAAVGAPRWTTAGDRLDPVAAQAAAGEPLADFIAGFPQGHMYYHRGPADRGNRVALRGDPCFCIVDAGDGRHLAFGHGAEPAPRPKPNGAAPAGAGKQIADAEWRKLGRDPQRWQPTVTLWDGVANRAAETIAAPGAAARLAFARGGERMAIASQTPIKSFTGSPDYAFAILQSFDRRRSEKRWSWDLPFFPAALAYGQDGALLLALGRDRRAGLGGGSAVVCGELFDANTGERKEKWTGRSERPAPEDGQLERDAAWPLPPAIFALHGERKLAAWFDGVETAILDAKTGQPKWKLGGKSGMDLPDVTALAFSPDGKTLVSGHADATLRVWKLP